MAHVPRVDYHCVTTLWQ